MTAAPPDSQPVPPKPDRDLAPTRHARLNTGITWAVALLAIVTAIWLFTRFNQFPYYYHADEPRKVEQVREKWRNFHHPLLMLMVTDRAAKIMKEMAGFDRDNLQNLVIIGRWFSAIFSAVAIGALCVAAGRRSWWPAALLTAAVLLVSHDLFRFAHYFKEDTALTLGWALCLLAAQVLSDRVTTARLIFAGIAAAICASAKYVGILLLPLLLIFLALHLWQTKRRLSAEDRTTSGIGKSLGLVLLAFLVSAVIINWRFFEEFQSFAGGFSRELAGVTEGHRGVRPQAHEGFNQFYFHLLRYATPLATWILGALYLPLVFWRNRAENRRTLLFDGVLFSSLLIYLVLISSTPKISDRYLLPVVVLLQFIAILGAGELLRLLFQPGSPVIPRFPRTARWATGALVILLAAGIFHDNFSRLQPIYAGFQKSSMEQLVDWVRAGNLPQDAVILQTRRYLPDPDIQFFRQWQSPFAQEIMEIDDVDETHSPAELRGLGATHILVSQGSYARYLMFKLEDLDGDPQALDQFARQARFYHEMTENGRLIWSRDPHLPMPLHPGLELWELPPAEELPITETLPAPGNSQPYP